MPEPEPTYFVQLFPIHLQAGFTSSGVVGGLTPWMAPALSGFVGTSRDGEDALAVIAESPIGWVRGVEFGKLEHEVLLLRRFSTDHAIATYAHAFGDIRPGGDPPDAIATTDSGDMGVESTVLTVPGRRGVNALFNKLRSKLASVNPAAFTNLVGYSVFIWFNDLTTADGRPPRPNDDATADELIRALADYVPSPDAMNVTSPTPDPAPLPPSTSTPSGATFYAVPIRASAPGSILFGLLGFEIGLVYTTVLTISEAWNEVQRLVDAHDKPGVDVLLISVAAPDRNGQVHPAEDAMAMFLREHPSGLPKAPTHIREVIMHQWTTGQATLLHPEVQELFGPLYTGFAQSHQPMPATGAPEPLDTDEPEATVETG